MVVVLGIDVHKKTHTLVAVDGNGRCLDEITVPATAAGHRQALAWAIGLGEGERIWGIEDCRTVSARLEAELGAAGEHVVRVPAKLTARTRASARTRGKSDPIDALAIARAVLREPGLPGPAHDAAAEELKLLVDYRDAVVGERTRDENRLRELLQRLDPEREPAPRTLDRAKVRAALARWLHGQAGVVARIAREELARIEDLTAKIAALGKEIAALVRDCALLQIRGCGPLSAARLIADTGPVARFRSADAFAMFNGTAPIQAWSGATHGRVRLNRGGDRKANAALHRIAVTQARLPGPGQDYYKRQLSSGKSRREALRCLKRRISNTVYRALLADAHTHENSSSLPAAA